MLRELREYTAECDVPEGGDDCHEIIQVQAPDETNALKALEGKGWVVQMRSEEYTSVPWAWLACPHCALGLSWALVVRKASRAILDDWYDLTMLCQHIPLFIVGYARRHCYIRGTCPICGPQVIEPTDP